MNGADEEENTIGSSYRAPKPTGIPPQFPGLLHTMLSNADRNGYTNIVSWQPHGLSFMIHDRKAFLEEVLPSYFKQSSFSSFRRQINTYKFRQVEKIGPDHKSYYHEFFQRDKPELLKKVVRFAGKKKSQSNHTWRELSFSIPSLDPFPQNFSEGQAQLAVAQVIPTGMTRTFVTPCAQDSDGVLPFSSLSVAPNDFSLCNRPAEAQTDSRLLASTGSVTPSTRFEMMGQRHAVVSSQYLRPSQREDHPGNVSNKPKIQWDQSFQDNHWAASSSNNFPSFLAPSGGMLQQRSRLFLEKSSSTTASTGRPLIQNPSAAAPAEQQPGLTRGPRTSASLTMNFGQHQEESSMDKD